MAHMERSYELNTAGEEDFRRDFTHLYHRIKRLEDGVIAYWLTGDAHAFVRSHMPREGLPAFVRVSFDGAAAEKFERRVERLLDGRYSRAAAQMPLPAFPVRIEIDLDGACGLFSYAFRGEEEFSGFCASVCALAKEKFRHRFSGPKEGEKGA